MSLFNSLDLAPPEIWFLIDDFIDNATDWLAFGRVIGVIGIRHRDATLQQHAKDRFTRKRHLKFRPLDSICNQLPAFVWQILEHQVWSTQYCLPNRQLHAIIDNTCEMAQVARHVWWWDNQRMCRTMIYADPEDGDTFDCALVVMTTLDGFSCEKILLAAFRSNESRQAFLDGHLNRWDHHLSTTIREPNMPFDIYEYESMVDGHKLYLCTHFAMNMHFCDFVRPEVHDHPGLCVTIGANLDSYRLIQGGKCGVLFKK